MALWQEMHVAILSEFDRSVPRTPVSKYLHANTSIADLLERDDLRASDIRPEVSASHPRSVF